MERQSKQPLRKGASGDLGQAGQAGCPMPTTNAEYLYGVPAAHSFVAAQAIKMVVELVGKKNRHGAADAADSGAARRHQFV